MPMHGKRYTEAASSVDRDRLYDPDEALALAKEISFENFDATVEVHIRLGVDPRHADQQVRDVVVLPHGLGKQIRVMVFVSGEGASIAREAGADFVADDDEMISRIQQGWTDFDIAIATPEAMGKVGKLGRVLGPRGLMPNPKTGTVVQVEDLPRAIQEAKAGRVEFRVDKSSNIHVPIGKVSFTPQQLFGNMAALLEAVRRARPAAAKGSYIRRVTVSTSMGPGIRVDPVQAQAMEVAD